MGRFVARALAGALLLPTLALAQDPLFQPRSVTTLRACQPWVMTADAAAEDAAWTWVDPCVHATVATGQHAVTGQWGVSVQWFLSLANPVPAGTTFEGFLSGVVLAGSDGIDRAVGAYAPGEWSPLAMSFTSFLDVPLREATFVSANHYMAAYDASGFADVRYGELEPLHGATVTPEPATLALTGGGLLALGLAWRRRRRRQR